LSGRRYSRPRTGLAPNLLPFIFDRFRKTSFEENRQGSGLVRAIAKQIAARHGIAIDVESKAGKGRCLRLPSYNKSIWGLGFAGYRFRRSFVPERFCLFASNRV
jgi:hypothetical protein